MTRLFQFLLFPGVLSFALSAVEPRLLFDPACGNPDDLARNRCTVERVVREDGKAVLRVETEPAPEWWPGVNLAPQDGSDAWNLAEYDLIAVDVKNISDVQIAVETQLDNDGADGDRFCVKSGAAINPGETVTIRTHFNCDAKLPEEVKLIGVRNSPDGLPGPRNLDPEKFRRLRVFISGPAEKYRFEIGDVRAEDARRPLPDALRSAATFFPLIDRYGQYIHAQWPEKIHSDSDLAAARQHEAAAIDARPAPASWDRYGGWADGPQLEATGFFRTEKYDGKWFLVDPEGKLFFSNGVCCVSYKVDAGGTALDHRENYFQWLPEKNDPRFGVCFSQHPAPVFEYYKRENIKPRTFDFYRANIIRKYGDDYLNQYATTSARRLPAWGMNTFGNWSDAGIIFQKKIPYVMTVYFNSPRLEGHDGYWEKFWEVFDPAFGENIIRDFRKVVGDNANDPMCIGYFIDNEITWGNQTAIAAAALRSPATQLSKIELRNDLRKKYADIAKLNSAWGTNYTSWDEFLKETTVPDLKEHPAAETDLTTFNEKVIDRYFRICRESLKAVSPGNMYLGCRFAGVNPMVERIAAKYCDAVSYNVYSFSSARFKADSEVDLPIIIGEFHMGAWDRAGFHTGLKGVASQADRARAYERYMEGALRNPRIIGAHWFAWNDQPVTGRSFDGENYPVGLVDITDTPYPELTEAARKIGENMYEYRLKYGERLK